MNCSSFHFVRRKYGVQNEKVLAPLTRRSGLITASTFLLLAAVACAQDAQFRFDANGNLTTQTAGVFALPEILGQPQNQIVPADGVASFSVTVANPQGVSYLWSHNGVPLVGVDNDSLTVINLNTNSEGLYQVVLTNPSGSVTSTPAMLWLDSDGDGMGDSWENSHFGDLAQNANSDADGDGSLNGQEFEDGTNPADTNSVLFHLTVVRDGGSVITSPDLAGYTNGQAVTLTATAASNELFHAWLGDIITRSNSVTLMMTNNKTLYARFAPIAFYWSSPTNGDWETATNWTPGLVPGSNDTVRIENGVTVALNTSADLAAFILSGVSPTLTGSGTLTVRESLDWSAGTMSGSGRTIVETNAILNIPGGFTLNTRTLENGGTAFWTGAGPSFVTGAVITNRPGALFYLPGTGALVSADATSRFDNAGTLRKTSNNGITTVGTRFNNYGTVEIQSGTLELTGGGANTGSYAVSAGAALNLSGGTNTSTGSSSITGAGQFTVSGATATLAGLVSVAGSNTFSGGTANLTGSYVCSDNVVTVSGGTVNVSGNCTFIDNTVTILGGTANFSGTGMMSPAQLNLSSGTLTGSSTLTITDTMNWTFGTMSGTGWTILPSGATLNVGSSSPAFLQRTLENGGTVNWTGAGGIALSTGAVITNRVGALFDARSAALLSAGSGANRFDNAGILRKSANTGTITCGVSFNNSGTVEIQTGTLLYNGSFTNKGAVTLSPNTTNRMTAGGAGDGTFNAAAASQVEWTGGTFTLDAGAQLNGAGVYRINQGTLTANTDIAADHLDLIAGTLNGGGRLTINSTMNWPGGTMSGSGRTLISAGATLNAAIPSVVLLNGRTLENSGTVLWTGTGSIGMTSSAVITNRAGALFDARSAALLSAGSGANRFDNAGTFRKSANTGTITCGVSFNNSGTVDLRSGIMKASGGYVSSSNALLNCTLSGTTAGTNYGQLQVAGTVTLNGALSVELVNGFSPALNDSFTVLTAGTRNGTFANFLYPSNTVTMQLSNTANSVIARVTEVAASPPIMLSAVLTGSNVLLTWTAISNSTYRIEFNPNLDPSNWNAVQGDVVGVGNTASKPDLLTSSNRFYRVRRLP